MKRFQIILIIVFLCPVLSGCGSLHSSYRELESMLVVQTLGVDLSSDGVTVSLASAAEGEEREGPMRLKCGGGSISQAIERLRDLSYEQELFCAHTGQVLIGESAARRSLQPFIAYICRNSDIRIDVPLFIVQQGSAEDLVINAGSRDKGISEILQAVIKDLDNRGRCRVFTAAECVESLERCGGCLICALRDTPAAESDSSPGSDSENGEGHTAAVCGYAVIKDGVLVDFIDEDGALGVSFLINDVGICDVPVSDRFGRSATLEISSGDCQIVPIWGSDGKLRRMQFNCDVNASLLEMENDNFLSDGEYAEYLSAQLEAELAERIEQVLSLSQELECDFLGLAVAAERASPLNFRRLGSDFASLLPDLELEVSVSAKIDHTNDIKGGEY